MIINPVMRIIVRICSKGNFQPCKVVEWALMKLLWAGLSLWRGLQVVGRSALKTTDKVGLSALLDVVRVLMLSAHDPSD